MKAHKDVGFPLTPDQKTTISFDELNKQLEKDAKKRKKQPNEDKQVENLKKIIAKQEDEIDQLIDEIRAYEKQNELHEENIGRLEDHINSYRTMLITTLEMME